jgi:hypothetical protein
VANQRHRDDSDVNRPNARTPLIAAFAARLSVHSAAALYQAFDPTFVDVVPLRTSL